MAGPGKTSAGLRTREAILEAALRLFLRQGYHATGVREIAREAGVSLGAAYNHFASKEQILEELLKQYNFYGAIGDALARASGDTVSDLLQSAFKEIMRGLEGKTHFPLLVSMDVLEFRGRHVAALAAREVPKLIAFFQRLYARGTERGEMRNVPPMLAVRTFIGMVFTSFIIENLVTVLDLGKIKLLPLHVENWEQGMVDILLHGILKESAEQKGAR